MGTQNKNDQTISVFFVWIFCAVPKEGEGSGRRSWDILHHWHVGWGFLVGSHLMSWFVLVFPARTWKKIGKYREERRNTTSTNKIRHHGVDTSSPMFWIQWYDWKVSTQILMDPMLKPSFVRSWDSRPFLQRNWTRDISQWGDALISAWLQLSWGFPTVGNWFLFLSQPYQLIELLALIHWFPQESLVSSAQSTPMPMPQDICTKRRDLHGEGQGYEKRCMLIYVAGPDLG